MVLHVINKEQDDDGNKTRKDKAEGRQKIADRHRSRHPEDVRAAGMD
jgi:hypothetical protein